MAGSPTKPARKASATRKANDRANSAPPTLNRSHLQGFVVGCVFGGLGCLGLFNALEADETAADTAPSAPPALEVTVGPRFDFYTVLPNQELDLNPDIEPADLQSGNTNSAQYLLQVGSFRQQADADRRRGERAQGDDDSDDDACPGPARLLGVLEVLAASKLQRAASAAVGAGWRRVHLDKVVEEPQPWRGVRLDGRRVVRPCVGLLGLGTHVLDKRHFARVRRGRVVDLVVVCAQGLLRERGRLREGLL